MKTQIFVFARGEYERCWEGDLASLPKVGDAVDTHKREPRYGG